MRATHVSLGHVNKMELNQRLFAHKALLIAEKAARKKDIGFAGRFMFSGTPVFPYLNE